MEPCTDSQLLQSHEQTMHATEPKLHLTASENFVSSAYNRRLESNTMLHMAGSDARLRCSDAGVSSVALDAKAAEGSYSSMP